MDYRLMYRQNNSRAPRALRAPRAPSASYARDGFAAVSGINTEYYKSQEWKELSRLRKEMDNNKCQQCGADGRDVQLHAHHIVSRSKGGADDIFNIKTLCINCHELEHRHMRKK